MSEENKDKKFIGKNQPIERIGDTVELNDPNEPLDEVERQKQLREKVKALQREREAERKLAAEKREKEEAIKKQDEETKRRIQEQSLLAGETEKHRTIRQEIKKLGDKLHAMEHSDSYIAPNKMKDVEEQIEFLKAEYLSIPYKLPTEKLYLVKSYQNQEYDIYSKDYGKTWSVSEGLPTARTYSRLKPIGKDSEGRPTQLEGFTRNDYLMKYFNQGVKTVTDIEYVDTEPEKIETAKPVQGAKPVEKPPIETVEYTIAICPYCKQTNNQVPVGKEHTCLVCGKTFTVTTGSKEEPKGESKATKNKGIVDKIKQKLS